MFQYPREVTVYNAVNTLALCVVWYFFGPQCAIALSLVVAALPYTLSTFFSGHPFLPDETDSVGVFFVHGTSAVVLLATLWHIEYGFSFSVALLIGALVIAVLGLTQWTHSMESRQPYLESFTLVITSVGVVGLLAGPIVWSFCYIHERTAKLTKPKEE